MARVRVKVPVEPKIIEMPAHIAQEMQAPVYVPPTVVAPGLPLSQETVTRQTAAETVTPQVAVSEEQPTQSPTKQGITITKRNLVFMGTGTLILILFVAGIFISRNSNSDIPKTLGASTTAQNEPQEYYNIVSKYVELPSDELPTVANVSDADKVKQQSAVLTDVQTDDKMLFFAKSRKVVVYRPSTKKVVAVVSLATPDSPTDTTTTKKQ